MNNAAHPVSFEPIFKPKPWGGARLKELLGKRPPGAGPIGESWELADMVGNESRVASGDCAGMTLSELMCAWGDDLLGGVQPSHERFPLLIKFLDAARDLSVQVHPKPTDAKPAADTDIKHEAWYVVAAEPGALIYAGLRDGFAPQQLAAAANTPEIVACLRHWPAQPGQCYYLPSGTPHALGAGLVVAEIQTPSDVTYRLYDWDRVGLDGRPRTLHIEQALANIRYDLDYGQLLQCAPAAGQARGVAALVRCPSFWIDACESAVTRRPLPAGRMRIWMILSGRGRTEQGGATLPFSTGDTLLIPAHGPERFVRFEQRCTWLDIVVPQPLKLTNA